MWRGEYKAAEGMVTLTGLDANTLRVFKEKLTFDNPAYVSAQRNGQSTEHLVPHIHAYREFSYADQDPRGDGVVRLPLQRVDDDGGYPEGLVHQALQVPRYAGKLLNIEFPTSIRYSRPCAANWEDMEVLHPPRDYQNDVAHKLDLWFEETASRLVDVGLALPCGYGKTYLALYCAAKFPGRVLVVCPTTVKLMEWREEIRKLTNVDSIGWVQGNKRDYADKAISLAMLKTLSMQDFPAEFLRGFDLVIWDEAHLCGAPMLSQALGRVHARNLTLTATPGRGVRRKVLELHNGGNWISVEDAPKTQVSAYFVPVKVPEYVRKLDWRMQKVRLAKNAHYTGVASTQVGNATAAGRRTLVLGAHIDPLYTLYKCFNGAGMVVGASSIKNVIEEDVRELFPEAKSWKECARLYLEYVKKTCNPILATGLTKTQPGGVGMDVPDLDAGVIMFPIGCPDMTQQLLGRWQRVAPGKKDPILVILFPNTQMGSTLAEKMARRLQSLGTIVNFRTEK